MQMAIDPDVSRKRAWKFGKPGPRLGNRPQAETPGETPNHRSGARARHVKRGLDHRLSQIREANEHLVVAAVRAQTRSEEAETASHLKDEFLATVSHEIRTPLGAVLGWARILESKQLPPEAERAIAAIGRNAHCSRAHDRLSPGYVANSQRSHPVGFPPCRSRCRRARGTRCGSPLGGDQECTSGVRGCSRLSNGSRRCRTAPAGDLESAGKCDQVHTRGRTCGYLHRVGDRTRGGQDDRHGPGHQSGPAATRIRAVSSRGRRDLRDDTPDWVSGLASPVTWWNCTGERCRRPVPAWDKVRRSPFVCRLQPALQKVRQPCEQANRPSFRRLFPPPPQLNGRRVRFVDRHSDRAHTAYGNCCGLAPA